MHAKVLLVMCITQLDKVRSGSRYGKVRAHPLHRCSSFDGAAMPKREGSAEMTDPIHSIFVKEKENWQQDRVERRITFL
jgi:hypothetical protein